MLKRHVGAATRHSSLIRQVLGQLESEDGTIPAQSGPAAPVSLHEPLSDSEMRVLRYLPTNLSAPEIAAELSLSVNTIRTHLRHVYEKLGAHSRFEAVELARSHGLVAPVIGLR